MPVRQSNCSPAWAAYKSGELAEALRRADAAILADEDDGRAWEVRGLVLRELHKPLGAADAIERASLLVPICPAARIALAQSYGTLRRTALARELYMELVASAELSVALLLEIAAGLEAVDASPLALEVCRRAGCLDPEAAQVYYDMGLYATRCGYELRVVEALIRRAIELEPRSLQYRLGLVSLLAQMDRIADACRAAQLLSSQQIAEINCKCCLDRISELFDRVGDAERRAVCRRRRQELGASVKGRSHTGRA